MTLVLIKSWNEAKPKKTNKQNKTTKQTNKQTQKQKNRNKNKTKQNKGKTSVFPVKGPKTAMHDAVLFFISSIEKPQCGMFFFYCDDSPPYGLCIDIKASAHMISMGLWWSSGLSRLLAFQASATRGEGILFWDVTIRWWLRLALIWLGNWWKHE